MFNHLTRERPDECISDLTLDAWMADDLPPQRAQEVASHLAACARCSDRRRQFLADRLVLFPDAPPSATEAPTAPLQATAKHAPPMAQRSRRITATLGAVAAAMGIAAVALLAQKPGAEAPGERTKGGASLPFFFVKHDGVVSRALDGARVPAGSSLRFVYNADNPVYLAIISLDPRNELSVYYPAKTHAAQVQPGREAALDSAVKLDGSLGQETLWALFCDQATPIDRLLAALRADPGAQTYDLVEGCRVQVVRFRKVAP
ncbi:MAG: hypothetical protein OXU20_04670 [Myxococcales bacterium]|nr:hypothetical protein [Myxococcales bacterium]MDD9969299.1 hypothetical protein [Myxococcales bacterium]